MSRTLALTLVLVVTLCSRCFSQWSFVDSIRVGGIEGATVLAADSLHHVLVYSKGLLIYDPATNQWRRASLPVASKPYMAVLPIGRILAAYSKAIYYSDDECMTWYQLGRGLDVSNISGIVWNDTTILAAGTSTTTGLMVLNKSDSNWQAVQSTLPIKTFSLAQHTLDGFFIVGNGRNIYRTTDPSKWAAKDSARTDTKFTRSAVLGNGDILALAQYSSSVYYSNDWGNTWSQPLSLPGLNSIRSLFATRGGIAAAATLDQGFYLTMDYARTWKSVRSLPVMLPLSMSSITDTDIVVASSSGIYRSIDSGASWKELDSAWAVTTATAIGAIGDTTFLSATLRGTYRSSALPPHWEPADDSLYGGLNRYQVARGALFGATRSHLVRWNGASWSALPNMFDDADPVTYAMSTTGRMFAATATQFFYLATDNQWRTVTQLFGLQIKETVADSAGRIYALVGTDSIFYSTDDGINWSELPGRPLNVSVSAFSAAHDTLLIAASGGGTNALYMTADLGQNWSSSPYILTGVRGIKSYQGRYFVYSSSSLLEREARATSWSNSDLTSPGSIIDFSISPNGRAYLLTGRGLFTRLLPGAPSNVNSAPSTPRALSIYPNPASNFATVTGATHVDLYDITGRQIASVANGDIDCTRYPSGIYTVRAHSGETARLIIVR